MLGAWTVLGGESSDSLDVSLIADVVVVSVTPVVAGVGLGPINEISNKLSPAHEYSDLDSKVRVILMRSLKYGIRIRTGYSLHRPNRGCGREGREGDRRSI